jgi:hypothetical protein
MDGRRIAILPALRIHKTLDTCRLRALLFPKHVLNFKQPHHRAEVLRRTQATDVKEEM